MGWCRLCGVGPNMPYKNPAKQRAYLRKWRRRNPGYHRAYNKKYYTKEMWEKYKKPAVAA